MAPSSERFWELDAVRGFALVLMVLYHFVFDLDFFGVIRLGRESAFFLAAPAIGALFLFVAGVSLSIAYCRVAGLGSAAVFSRQLGRVLLLSAVAAGITFATLVYPGDGFVAFGIIHLMAFSAFFSIFFRGLGLANLALGVAFILAGVAAGSLLVDSPFFFWLGFPFPGFHSLDYYPVLPWFGVVLVGMSVGNVIYPGAKRAFRPPVFGRFAALGFLGRNSLLIYLVHQPVLASAILAFKSLVH